MSDWLTSGARGYVRKTEAWSAEQETILKNSLGKPNKQIAKELSRVGPERSVSSIKNKRRKFEASKRVPQERKANGWPVVNGDVRQQSDRFRVALLEAMLRDVRKRRHG